MESVRRTIGDDTNTPTEIFRLAGTIASWEMLSWWQHLFRTPERRRLERELRCATDLVTDYLLRINTTDPAQVLIFLPLYTRACTELFVSKLRLW